MTSDIAALQKWSALDKKTQKLLLSNAFCAKCGVTMVIDYEMVSDKYGILIKGKCKECGADVARLGEEE